MSPQEDIQVNDQTQINVQRNMGNPSIVSVKVLAAAGLNKNGQHYPQGATLQMNSETAERFRAINEVEILSTSEGVI